MIQQQFCYPNSQHCIEPSTSCRTHFSQFHAFLVLNPVRVWHKLPALSMRFMAPPCLCGWTTVSPLHPQALQVAQGGVGQGFLG